MSSEENSTPRRFVIEAVTHDADTGSSNTVRRQRASNASASSCSSIMEEIEMSPEDNNNNGEARKVSLKLPDEDEKEGRKKSAAGSEEGGGVDKKKMSYRKRSSFLLTPRPLKHYLTREVLPHVDNYRNRMSFHKGKPSTYYKVFSNVFVSREARPLKTDSGRAS